MIRIKENSRKDMANHQNLGIKFVLENCTVSFHNGVKSQDKNRTIYRKSECVKQEVQAQPVYIKAPVLDSSGSVSLAPHELSCII